MKKILAILLVMAMLCSFAACGATETTAPETTAPDTTNPETTAPVEDETTAPVEDETTAPVEDNTTAPDPTEPSVDPTEPSVDPTEPSVDPTEPSVDPTEPDDGNEPSDPWAEYEIITIEEALELCEQFVSSPSADRYYIRGVITEIKSEQYGQFIISDGTGSIEVYGSYSADGSLRYSEMSEKPVLGDEVLFHATLQYYSSKTKEIQNGRIIDFIAGEPAPAPELPEFDTTLTVKQLLALALADGETTSGRYYVRVTVSSVTNAEYGAMIVADETGSISVYGSYGADGVDRYNTLEDKPVKGDEVLLYVNVKKFNGNLEINSAWIQEVVHSTVDVDDYIEMTIEEARNAEVGTLVKVTGVVARITYANGMKPNGALIVDGTNAIYIYDGDLAGRVSVGNRITIGATKTMWILDTEQTNANKFGYKGCNQLDSAWLVENDNGNHAFDTSWITESTVKEIMDNPVSNDITSTIFKVTALVSRVDGNGFISYYINDLDGTTGSYSYTQCNGNDFSWLDEFDGKICTVYLCPLNCKSTASGCAYRFLPVAVEDEGFVFDTNDAAEFAVKYYGVDQFMANYGGNPALKLVTSVSSELLNFENATLSYTSSDPSVISIDDNVMNCLASGTATITITGTYGNASYSQDVEITVKIAEQIDAGTVKDAIDADLEEIVTIRGVVASSLVNKDGFYLIDETGVIAVLTDKETLATLKLGYEVVIQGVRAFDGKTADSTWCTTCVKDAQVLANYYGEHEYSTATFIYGKTLADFAALDVNEDHTTEVYVVKATIKFVENYYYTRYDIADGDTTIVLYCANGGQYSFLKQYINQEVTIELVPCNWSSKGTYPGCILSITTADGTKIVNNCNFG